MKHDPVSRREFLKTTGSSGVSAWLAAQWPLLLSLGAAACKQQQTGAAFVSFDAAVAADLNAIAEQIIPTGETPGAEDAGVIYFIDQALQGFMSGARSFVMAELEKLNQQVAGEHAGSHRFANLSSQDQQRLLISIERSPFFDTLRFLTVAGMFAMPKHGGNREHLGWALLNFDHRHGWQPPFGHYDQGYHPSPGAAETAAGEEYD